MLKRSNDRKVTNKVSPNGKTSKIANSFGLPSGKEFSCPGQTAICGKVCYAGKLEKIYKGVKDVLIHNWTELLYADYLGGIPAMAQLLDEMIVEFDKECSKHDAPRVFRIHWDGDMFSVDYAKAWAYVIRNNSHIQFWCYTRSLDCVPILAGIDNLSLYVSADSENMSEAETIGKRYGVPLARLHDTFKAASEYLTDSKRYACPENKGSLPLITTKGSACIRCGVCVFARGSVDFAISKGNA